MQLAEDEPAAERRAAKALEPASVARQVVLGRVVVKGERLSRRQRAARHEADAEVGPDDHVAVRVAGVAQEVVEVVRRERGREEARPTMC